MGFDRILQLTVLPLSSLSTSLKYIAVSLMPINKVIDIGMQMPSIADVSFLQSNGQFRISFRTFSPQIWCASGTLISHDL